MFVNKQSKPILLVVILLVIDIVNICGQEFINTRKITISREDTTIVAGILADLKLESIQPNVYYYWYSNSGINCNEGGFSGNLLHGEYLEFNKEGSLILKGYYNKGLKAGEWVYWYPNGSRKKVFEFKEGKLNGSYTEYSVDGSTVYHSKYKNGKLRGIETYLRQDTIFTINHRKNFFLQKNRNNDEPQ